MKTFAAPEIPARGSHTRRIFALHRWLGRVLMLYLCLIFASGTLLVFGDELESLIFPQMQRQSSPNSLAGPNALAAPAPPPARPGALLDAARAAWPGAQPLILRLPGSGWFAASVEMRQDKSDFIVWLDPVTAAVQGRTPVLGPKELLRRLHVSLLQEGRLPLMLTSSVALLLMVQLGLGLAAYRGFWRGYGRLPRLPGGGLRQQQGRMLWGGWHRWAGVWSLPVLAVTCLTGVLYFSETLGFEPGLPEPARAALRTAALPEGFGGARLDAAVAVALAGLPGLAIREIYFPPARTGGVVVRGDLGALLVRPRANAVTVDPVTLAVLGAHRAQDLPLARRFTEAADPLHFGTWGGTPTRVIWLCSGGLAVILAVSGLKLASWRLAPAPGQPSLAAALRAIFLPARLALVAAGLVVAAAALRMVV